MTYLVNDLFYTLQGEGANVGRPAVFCRFSRCNLWSGEEGDRHRAICSFCDTDFTDYEEIDQPALIERVEALWPGDDYRFVVFTGGEPALQLDWDLIHELHLRGFMCAVETNGTQDLPPNLDWVCVSPKTRRLRVRSGDELKLVYPQEKIKPEMYAGLGFKQFWLSPMDGPDLEVNRGAAVEYCLAHPQWKLNTQVHKIVGVK